MEEFREVFNLDLFGYNIGISETVVIQWIIIMCFFMLAVLLTRNLKKIPGKKQTVLEIIVQSINNFVVDIMGKECMVFVPYIGALLVFILTMNLIPLIGFKAPTEDFSVTTGLAIVSFLVIQTYAIKKVGLWHYIKGYASPLPLLLPLNIMERIMLPVSLSLRLFGNITAGAVIMGLIYKSLGSISFVAQLGIPIPLHAYFDVFDGVLQTIIFTMLTMINIKIIADH